MSRAEVKKDPAGDISKDARQCYRHSVLTVQCAKAGERHHDGKDDAANASEDGMPKVQRNGIAHTYGVLD